MIQHYFKFLFFKLYATNQHGVHSPFLYALVCFCFYNTSWNRKGLKPWKSKMHNRIAIEITKQLHLFVKQACTDFQIDLLKVIHTRNKTLAQWIEEQKIEDKPHITLIDNLHLQRGSWNDFKNKSQYIHLDLFFYGIVIHRPQQTAETFFLKVF